MKESFNGTVLLYNCYEKVDSFQKLHDKSIVPTNFREVLENHFPNIHENGFHRTVKGEGYLLYWMGPKNGLSASIQIYFSGEEGLLELVELCKKHHWQMFHCIGKGVIIDLYNPIWE